jgi:hypothetical protein
MPRRKTSEHFISFSLVKGLHFRAFMDFSSNTVAEGMEGGKQGFWVSPFCLTFEGIASSGPVDHRG